MTRPGRGRRAGRDEVGPAEQAVARDRGDLEGRTPASARRRDAVRGVDARCAVRQPSPTPGRRGRRGPRRSGPAPWAPRAAGERRVAQRAVPRPARGAAASGVATAASRPQPAGDLDGDPRPRRPPTIAAIDRGMCRLPGPGAVQVDDVDPASAGVGEPRATATGSSANVVSRSKSPCSSRTTRPPRRSIAGRISKLACHRRAPW